MTAFENIVYALLLRKVHPPRGRGARVHKLVTHLGVKIDLEIFTPT